MGGELVHEIDGHTQSKSVGLNHVLFVLLHLLYCIDLYCASLGSHTHDFADSEMLNPGGQV